MEIAGTTPGSGHDQITVVGAATLGGTLHIDTLVPPMTGGPPGVIGDTFQIMTFASQTGTFDEVNGRHVDDGVFYDVDINTSDVTLGAFQALEGDANGDRNVDITDFQLFLTGFTATMGTLNWTEGDFDDDGTVDITDFTVYFLPNFGTMGYGAVPLPEPSSIVLLILASLVVVARLCVR